MKTELYGCFGAGMLSDARWGWRVLQPNPYSPDGALETLTVGEQETLHEVLWAGISPKAGKEVRVSTKQ